MNKMRMKVFALDHFQDEILKVKETLNGKKVQILFTTYNTVSDYPTGRVDTGKDDLEIYVENGNMPRNPMVVIGLAMEVNCPFHPIAQAMGRQATNQMKQDGEEAQKKVSTRAAQVLNEAKKNVIIVVYVGLSAFMPVLEFIKRVSEEHPLAKIIAVSCDCNNPRDFMPHGKEIDSLVMTSECGGRQAMKTILEGFRKAW